MTTVQKVSQKQAHPNAIDAPGLISDTEIKVILVAVPLFMLVRQTLLSMKIVYSLAERMFVFELSFASKLFIAVHEAVSNAYPGKNKEDRLEPNTPTCKLFCYGGTNLRQ